jgi:hypothetical protein
MKEAKIQRQQSGRPPPGYNGQPPSQPPGAPPGPPLGPPSGPPPGPPPGNDQPPASDGPHY